MKIPTTEVRKDIEKRTHEFNIIGTKFELSVGKKINTFGRIVRFTLHKWTVDAN